MDVDYPLNQKSATPEYVLSVFQDHHRQACARHQGDSSVALTSDTTVDEWRDADDLLAWRGLARALNAEWKIDCLSADWKRVLEPAGKRKLADVCGLIARVASQPLVRPAPVFGCRVCRRARS
jgi:hypothetical protein